MLIDYKRIDLFGKMLFEKAVIRPPFRKPNPMPDEACFLHIRKGEYHSISEEDSLLVRNGQSVLMNCGNYLSQMLPDPATGLYEAVAVHFHPDVLLRIYSNDLPSFLAKEQDSMAPRMSLVHSSIPIEKYIEDILFYFEHPHLANEEILILKTREIILLLMQTSDAPHVRRILENLFSPRTADFKSIVEAHLFTELTSSELAQLANMSLSSFKRAFKATFNATPQSFIQQRRLEHSRKLLCITDRPVGDIAFDCCFKSISHFSKKFRETYGASPTVYRMNLRD